MANSTRGEKVSYSPIIVSGARRGIVDTGARGFSPMVGILIFNRRRKFESMLFIEGVHGDNMNLTLRDLIRERANYLQDFFQRRCDIFFRETAFDLVVGREIKETLVSFDPNSALMLQNLPWFCPVGFINQTNHWRDERIHASYSDANYVAKFIDGVEIIPKFADEDAELSRLSLTVKDFHVEI